MQEETMTSLAEGVTPDLIRQRIGAGWTKERAETTPKKKKKKHGGKYS